MQLGLALVTVVVDPDALGRHLLAEHALDPVLVLVAPVLDDVDLALDDPLVAVWPIMAVPQQALARIVHPDLDVGVGVVAADHAPGV